MDFASLCTIPSLSFLLFKQVQVCPKAQNGLTGDNTVDQRGGSVLSRVVYLRLNFVPGTVVFHEEMDRSHGPVASYFNKGSRKRSGDLRCDEGHQAAWHSRRGSAQPGSGLITCFYSSKD